MPGFCSLKPVSCPKLKNPSSFLQDASATAFRLVKGKKRAKRGQNNLHSKSFSITLPFPTVFFYTFATVSSRKPPGGEGETLY